MKKGSKIGLEWHEQAANDESYLVKTQDTGFSKFKAEGRLVLRPASRVRRPDRVETYGTGKSAKLGEWNVQAAAVQAHLLKADGTSDTVSGASIHLTMTPLAVEALKAAR